jgi:hypothetical protein
VQLVWDVFGRSLRHVGHCMCPVCVEMNFLIRIFPILVGVVRSFSWSCGELKVSSRVGSGRVSLCSLRIEVAIGMKFRW